MSKKYSKKDFGYLMDEFQKLYEKKPRKVQKESYYSLLQMGKIKVEGFNKFKNSLPLIISIIIILVNICTCFFIKEQIIMAMVGIPLLLFGLSYSLNGSESYNIVGLFTYVLYGLIAINVVCFAKITRNPILTDKPTLIIILLLASLILLLSSIIYGIIYIKSEDLKIKPTNKAIPYALAALTIIIIHGLTIFLSI